MNAKEWTHPDLNLNESMNLGEILNATVGNMKIWLRTIFLAKEYVKKKLEDGEKHKER